MDDLIKRVATRHLAKMHVEPHVKRNALAMAEELADARKALDKAEQFSRTLRMEPSLDWIPDLVKKIAEDHRELSKNIDETLEYLKDGDTRSASGHTLDMKVAVNSNAPGLEAIMTPAVGPKLKALSDKINNLVDKAETGSVDLDKTFDVVIKDLYRMANLYRPFTSGWHKEEDFLSSFQKIGPMAKTLYHQTRQLNEVYAFAGEKKYRTVDLLTRIGTETATLVAAYNQLYRILN